MIFEVSLLLLLSVMVRRNFNVRIRTKALFIAAAGAAAAQNLVVDATPSHVANSFSPIRALGAGVDRIGVGLADKMLVEPMLKEILASGWQPVTYRQNTELHAEAWHWNPQGTWSDPAGRGYFTGNATPVEMIRHSWGYTLPHRGMSRGRDGLNYSVLTRRSRYLLEEQSVFDTRVHGRGRFASSAMGDRRPRRSPESQRRSHCLGRTLCQRLPRSVLVRR
jgi:hypothetical protein